jgi:triosephosphate isomerase
MNLTRELCCSVAQALKDELADVTNVRLAVCPTFVYIDAVARVLAGSNIGVGAQNMYVEEKGAFTGEIAGPMLLDVGCRYVILGHSERRHVMGEPDEFISAKVLKALECGLEPILCVGEKLDQREAGETEAVVSGQLTAGLQGVSAEQMAKVVVAYEPVWAIGTGKTATPDQAEEVHALLRNVLGGLYNADVADATIIQYGGSVKASNAAELLSAPNVDGGLVGGASLTAEAFVPLVRAAAGVTK